MAVGRTAGAVGGLADSGLVKRLTKGRLWIAALAALLVGIVALNVVSLSLNSRSSDAARAVENLEREGSSLRAQLAQELSTQRVQSVAAGLGLIYPEPGAISYLRPSEGDAAEAARRLRSGELAAVPVTPVAPVFTDLTEVTLEEVAPAEPAVETAPAPTDDAVASEPVQTAPPSDGAAADTTGGAIASP